MTDVPAGDLVEWLSQRRRGGDAVVPCGTCAACCESSMFVHIEPDETATLRRVPRELLFPAPGMPLGHVVMGFDEHGRCPMLADGRCSIYDNRPRTCRTFDCRVYAAAGLEPDGHPLVVDRVRAWRFTVPTPRDEAVAAAVRAAASFLRARPECFPHGAPPTSPTPLALLAIDLHGLFLDNDQVVTPSVEAVRAAVLARGRS